MDRRGFLISVLAAGGGLAVPTRPASALQVVECGDGAAASACGVMDAHDDLLRQMEQALAERDMAEADRKAVLAALTCPVCGMPLLARSGMF